MTAQAMFWTVMVTAAYVATDYLEENLRVSRTYFYNAKDKASMDTLHLEYHELTRSFRQIQTQIFELIDQIKNPEAHDYLKYRLGRRVIGLKKLIKRFDAFLSVEVNAKTEDDIDHILFDRNVYLNYYFTCITGALDNMAWVVNLELNVGVTNPQKITLQGKEILAACSDELVTTLKNSQNTTKHWKHFRDPAAHRIQPYSPPYLVDEESGEKHFLSVYTMNPGKSFVAKFHGQMISDLKTLDLIILSFIKMMRVN
ncbi:MAG: hypothetical protein ACRBBP_00675 [Bdellovibrionales bacterium]